MVLQGGIGLNYGCRATVVDLIHSGDDLIHNGVRRARGVDLIDNAVVNLKKNWLPKNWRPKNWLPKNWAFSAIPIYWECNGVLGYSDLLGLGVLSYSDLLGLGVPDEWLLDLLVEHSGPMGPVAWVALVAYWVP